MNVRSSVFLFAVALMVCRVDSFTSQKCNEAETSEKGIGRFLENANCTLQEKRQTIKIGLNSIHNTLKAGVDHFKNKFAAKQATTEPDVESKTDQYDGLDHQIDVRILQNNEARAKREVTGDNENQGKSKNSIL